MSSIKRRIAVKTDAGTQTYNVLSIERIGEPNAYLVRIAYGSGEWLAAGEYGATLHGETTQAGRLAVFDYETEGDPWLFLGIFRPASSV